MAAHDLRLRTRTQEAEFEMARSTKTAKDKKKPKATTVLRPMPTLISTAALPATEEFRKALAAEIGPYVKSLEAATKSLEVAVRELNLCKELFKDRMEMVSTMGAQMVSLSGARMPH